MKKVVFLTLTLVLLLGIGVFLTAYAENDENTIMPRYSYTSSISASLSFSGNTANCSGIVTPSQGHNVSVTVTLYRQNGSSWVYVASWSGSATGGASAGAGGSANVSSGTYKVVTKGNVGNGLEYPTKTITRTK